VIERLLAYRALAYVLADNVQTRQVRRATQCMCVCAVRRC
jgi:hypothetical protein